MEAELWKSCPQIEIDPDVVHGEPVFRGTRLPVEAIMENVDAFMEIEGQSLEDAIASTLRCFPGTPGGTDGIRAVLTHRATQELMMQS